MRVRGLKLHILTNYLQALNVAPHAGAWIETVKSLASIVQGRVAPHAGAWIETSKRSLTL